VAAMKAIDELLEIGSDRRAKPPSAASQRPSDRVDIPT